VRRGYSKYRNNNRKNRAGFLFLQEESTDLENVASERKIDGIADYRARQAQTQTGHMGDVADQIVRMFRFAGSQIKFQNETI